MTFDINEVLAQMSGAIKNEVSDNWSLIKKTTNNFLQSRKARLELLTSLRLDNQLSEEFFQARLEDEKKILTSELHAVAVITKVTAQNAANAAISILSNAVKTALGIL